MPRKATNAETTTEPVQTVPDFTIAERRAKHGTKDALHQLAEIPLHDQSEPMTTYWVNTEEHSNRFIEATQIEGWVPVRLTELKINAKLSGFAKTPEGYVARGVRASEVLMKMPTRLYEAMLWQANAAREKERKSPAAMRRRTQEQLAAEGNTQAAEALDKRAYMADAVFKESIERHQVEDE